ncbi:MAG: M56 family metallopeptidase [Pirellulaceae bacterium]
MNAIVIALETDGWSLLLRQTIQVTVVIIVVGLIVRAVCRNRPQLAHGLWALVLLKCLTPPIIALPLSPFSIVGMTSEETASRETRQESAKESTFHASQRSSVAAELNTSALSSHGAAAADRRAIELGSTTPRQPVPSKRLTRSTAPGVSASLSSLQVSIVVWTFGRIALFVWFIGVGIASFSIAIKLARFLRDVRRNRVPARDETVKLLHQTISDMGLEGRGIARTQVQVVDCLIGPAVVGLWRPTILLPRVLETDCNRDELRMLLAHELTHIHRADLWWAYLQTLVSCVWWFHPLMRMVGRRFDNATEQSCDEETVTRLGCRPAEYARALLKVLEQKHLLRVAPALPGVRQSALTS